MSTTKRTHWLRRLFGKKKAVSSTIRVKRSTPLLKRVKRFVYGRSTPRSVSTESESWSTLYKFPTNLIKDTVFPGSAVINGDKINGHLSMITRISHEIFDITHISSDTNAVSASQINIGNYDLYPESCCLTYIGVNHVKVREQVVSKLKDMTAADFSYSYPELCRIIFNQHCGENDQSKLEGFAQDIVNQSNIICSGIFLHVYIKTFTDLNMDLSSVFPLNPFACTPARIVNVLKTNTNWKVVPLKLLLLATPLAYAHPMKETQQKTYNKYLSEANCRLITMDNTGECDVTSKTHEDRDVVKASEFYWTKLDFEFIPGIYDKKAKKTLIKPLFICGTHPSQKSTHVQYQTSQRQ